MPQGFVPAQDKYYLVGIAQLPTGASLDRTEAVVKQMTEIALNEPGVESVMAFPGFTPSGPVNVPNSALMFAMLCLIHLRLVRTPHYQQEQLLEN